MIESMACEPTDTKSLRPPSRLIWRGEYIGTPATDMLGSLISSLSYQSPERDRLVHPPKELRRGMNLQIPSAEGDKLTQRRRRSPTAKISHRLSVHPVAGATHALNGSHILPKDARFWKAGAVMPELRDGGPKHFNSSTTKSVWTLPTERRIASLSWILFQRISPLYAMLALSWGGMLLTCLFCLLVSQYRW